MPNQEKPKGLRPAQRNFFKMFGNEGPKPIPPKLALIYGYPLAAIISQLLFWRGQQKRRDGLIYKTEKDLIRELGITSAQQRLAIAKGKGFGFLKVTRKGIPAKRHYGLDYRWLEIATIAEAERKKVNLLLSPDQQSRYASYTGSDNSRTNTDNTSDNTNRKETFESAADVLLKKYGKG